MAALTNQLSQGLNSCYMTRTTAVSGDKPLTRQPSGASGHKAGEHIHHARGILQAGGLRAGHGTLGIGKWATT